MAFRTTVAPPIPAEIISLFRKSETILAHVPCRIRDGNAMISAHAILVADRSTEGSAAVMVLTNDPMNYRVLQLIPVNHSFALSLNQTPPTPSMSHFHQSSRPHMTLSLWSKSVKVELRIYATEILSTQNFMNQIKKQIDLSRSLIPLPLSPSWLGYYPVEPQNPLDLDEESTSSLSDGFGVVSPSTSSGNLDKGINDLEILDKSIGQSDEEVEESINPFSSGFSRTGYLRRKLFKREKEWSTRQPLKIRIASYNVNDRLPHKGTEELSSMVGKGEEDILVFGFQELDLRRAAMLVSQGNSRADDWAEGLMRGLGGARSSYEKVAITQYVGVMMIVFIKSDLKPFVSKVDTCEKGIGLLGFGGNKAGVAVRLKVHDTTFCFVNSHLAAFANALDRRRADYQALQTGLIFPNYIGTEESIAADEFCPELPGKQTTVDDCHAMFWLGDLNYRLNIDDDILKTWVEEKKWADVMEKDQLRLDIRAGKSFNGFEEAEIGFPPTYKYVHGSDTLDTKRAPAYTDRILWKIPNIPSSSSPIPPSSGSNGLPGSFAQAGPSPSSTSTPSTVPQTDASIPAPSNKHPMRCTEYTSHPIFWSDHRPVSATFETEVRVADIDKRKECLNDARRQLEKLEEVWRPAVIVSDLEIDFGKVKYRRQILKTILIKNAGRVPATFSFREPKPGWSICKPFFWVLPNTATVPPGSSCSLTLIAYVNEHLARSLTGGEDMKDVLVLQLKEGKDLFMTLSATFLPTIIGLPLELIPDLSISIRSIPIDERKALAASTQSQEGPITPAKKNDEGVTRPAKEIWRLLEYLMENGQGQTLWQENEDITDISVLDIIEAIDTASPLPYSSAPAVSLALLHILQSFPKPLIPDQWHRFCLDVKSRDEAFACLEGIQGVNTNVLIGLMSVVRLCSATTPNIGQIDSIEVSDNANSQIPVEIIDIQAMAVFGPIQANSTTREKEMDGRRTFVKFLLDG